MSHSHQVPFFIDCCHKPNCFRDILLRFWLACHSGRLGKSACAQVNSVSISLLGCRCIILTNGAFLGEISWCTAGAKECILGAGVGHCVLGEGTWQCPDRGDSINSCKNCSKVYVTSWLLEVHRTRIGHLPSSYKNCGQLASFTVIHAYESDQSMPLRCIENRTRVNRWCKWRKHPTWWFDGIGLIQA